MSSAHPSLVVCAPRALSPRLCRACLPAAHACLSCALNSVMGYKASLSCAARRLCRTRGASIVRSSLRTPSSIMSDRTFCRGQPCPSLLRQRILYHDRIFLVARATLSCAPKACHARLTCSVVHMESSLKWPTLLQPRNPLSRHKFSLPWPTLSQHKTALSRHNSSLP